MTSGLLGNEEGLGNVVRHYRFVAVLCMSQIITGCAAGTADPLLGRWDVVADPDLFLDAIQHAVSEVDPTVSEAIGSTKDGDQLAMREEYDFRSDGTMTSTMFFGAKAIPVDGTWRLVGRNGNDARYRLVLGRKKSEIDARMNFETVDRVRVNWTRDGEEYSFSLVRHQAK